MAKSVSQELSKHFDQGPQAVIFRFFFISHLFFIGELIIKLSLFEFFFKFKIFTGNKAVWIFHWGHSQRITLEILSNKLWLSMNNPSFGP